MELGGNDAFIILEDADFDLLDKTIFFARLYNTGQVCTSSKRFCRLLVKKTMTNSLIWWSNISNQPNGVTQWIKRQL